MSEDDPRHGTNPGYNAGCREQCCRRAHANYQKRRQWDQMRGLPRIVPAIGVRRRVEALRALGWSGASILREVGMSPGNLNRLIEPETMTRGLRDRFIAAYERMVDQPPVGNAQSIVRAKNQATRMGYQLPEAWFNMDDPDDRPDRGYTEMNSRAHGKRGDVDEVLVERIIGGDFSLASSTSKPEKVAVVTRWRADGRSLNELDRLSGWQSRRYLDGEAA